MRLVVIGDLLLDRDVCGNVERLCPDAPVPVLDATASNDRPGGAGLAALAARHLSGVDHVVLVTAAGNGEATDRAIQLLNEAAVGVISVSAQGALPEKIRVRAANQSLLRIDRGGRGPRLDIDASLPDAAARAIRSADGLLVADYGNGMAALAALRAAVASRSALVPVVWDPHLRGPQPLPGTWLVCPNEAEAAACRASAGSPTTDVAAGAVELRRRWQARGVAITRGSRGAVLAGGPDDALRVVTPPRRADGSAAADPANPADTCGAGDVFAAAALIALARGQNLVEAVEGGVARASAYVWRGGPATLGPAGHRSSSEAAPGGLLALSEAAQLARRVRRDGGTIVVAGGCFDLLHAGHVRLLEEARNLGDRLIVLLNSDRSVRRLKGPGRPVQRAADRAALLCALRSVDAVVVFEEATPLAALDALRPHLFVKGGDYADVELPEASVLDRWGGRVVVLPYLAGRSTTRLVEASRAS